MSRKNDEYIIGEFELESKVGNVKGSTHSIKNRLKSYLERANMGNCAQLKVEGNRVFVYGDPAIDVLRSFEEQTNSKGKLKVKFISHTLKGIEDPSSLDELEQLREKYGDLQENYEHLEQKHATSKETAKNLRSSIKTAESRLEKVEKEREEVEINYLETLVEIDSLKGQLVQKPVEAVEPGNLEKTLQDSENAYFSRQEDLIAITFNQILNEIEDRTLYEETKELQRAEKTIEERDLYIKEYGKKALEHLPEEAKKLTKEEWENAEKVVAKYKEHTKKVKPLELPVRIAETDERAVVVIPVNPASKNKVSKKLYEALLTYGAEMQSEFDLDVSHIEGSFATLKLEGNIDYESIEERLMKEFGEISEVTGININPFRTNYFLEVAKEETPEEEEARLLEDLYIRQKLSGPKIAESLGVSDQTIYNKLDKYGIPKRKYGRKSAESESLGDLMKSRIKELGYENQQSFATENDFDPSLISRYISGEHKPKPKNQKRLAKALNVSLSEIKKRI